MSGPESQPELTILITAHNEADRIQPSLRAILNQDYPMERLEILLVDDRSDDGTADLARRMSIDSLRVLRIDSPPEGMTARQAALDLGLREARGEVVLVTDAGGRVPREWVRELTGHLGFRDGAATGPIVYAGGEPMLARYQTLDTLVTFTLNRWARRHGKPTGIVGANMAIRREAYLATGGFPVIGFALAEDLALGQALSREGWSIRYLTSPATQKLASESPGDLVRQLRRRVANQPKSVQTVVWLMVFSNLILLTGWLIWGKFWLFLLLARYLIGLAWISISVSQYGSLDLVQWVWLYEPVKTFLEIWVWLVNRVRPHWEWGGLRYNRPAQVPPENPEEAGSDKPQVEKKSAE